MLFLYKLSNDAFHTEVDTIQSFAFLIQLTVLAQRKDKI